ncbi:MAG: YajG family lipoprotein [Woeseia sp.]
MKALSLIALIFLGGCAFTPMEVQLAPNTAVSASDIGHGHTVYLTVFDERASTSVGNRGSAYMKGAQITLADDLSAVVQSAVSEMLTVKGFQMAYQQPEIPHAALRLDIRGLSYETSTGFWTGGVEVTAALKATAQNAVENYENFYRYDNEDRVVVVPGAEANSERINAALDSVLQQLMADRKLVEVLAKR